MNGKLKGGLTIGGVSGVSIFGVIAIFNFLTSPIKEDIKEVKIETEKLEEKHNTDVKGIGEKLDVILSLAQEQKTGQAEMGKDIQYIQRDIKEIKAK